MNASAKIVVYDTKAPQRECDSFGFYHLWGTTIQLSASVISFLYKHLAYGRVLRNTGRRYRNLPFTCICVYLHRCVFKYYPSK
jgi:hypothetical protein